VRCDQRIPLGGTPNQRIAARVKALHALDGAPTKKPFAQLTIYAPALSHPTGIALFDYKWPGSPKVILVGIEPA